MRKKRPEQPPEPLWSRRQKKEPYVDFMGSGGPLRARKDKPGELDIPPGDAKIWREERSREAKRRMARTAIVDGEFLEGIIH